MPLADADAERLASRVINAWRSSAAIPPISDELPDFGLREAYDVAARVARQRIGNGERPVGWKIGFTNRTIWDEYGVHAPIWGFMYDSTVAATDTATPIICPLAALMEPRIEAEIVFRIAERPAPGMNEAELLACIDAVGHGFEIVQSVYPAWRFRAADTIAAFALHGVYRHGALSPLSGGTSRAEWLHGLSEFRITLDRDGETVDIGAAANVLGGPLSALRHFVEGLRAFPAVRGIEPGDLITTGTVTRAFPVQPGERWRSQIHGLPLPGLEIAFT